MCEFSGLIDWGQVLYLVFYAKTTKITPYHFQMASSVPTLTTQQYKSEQNMNIGSSQTKSRKSVINSDSILPLIQFP
jgi:hypothetical protein